MSTTRPLTLSIVLSLSFHALVLSSCESPLPRPPRLSATVTPVTVHAPPLEALVVGRRLPKYQLQCGQDLHRTTSSTPRAELEARLRTSAQLHQAME